MKNIRMVHRLALLLGVIGAATALNGCFNLDDSLFNETKLSSYSLPTTIIPETSRTQVVLESQGKKIYGYFVKSNGTMPGVTILYNHGNKDHLQYYWDRVEMLYQTGANVFVYDYQGFGMSEGVPSEAGLYSDAAAALQYVLSRGDVDSLHIIYYGFSLGCAAAVNLAANVKAPAALILEAPFASASALAKSGYLLELPGSYVMRGVYDNAEKITRVHTPLLLLHGESDSFIDIQNNGQVVFDRANEPKTFIRVKGANHTDVPQKLGEEKYLGTIRDFIAPRPTNY
jgi:fermentation-respiration switch protein FrsA (DUF1100 family)